MDNILYYTLITFHETRFVEKPFPSFPSPVVCRFPSRTPFCTHCLQLVTVIQTRACYCFVWWPAILQLKPALCGEGWRPRTLYNSVRSAAHVPHARKERQVSKLCLTSSWWGWVLAIIHQDLEPAWSPTLPVACSRPCPFSANPHLVLHLNQFLPKNSSSTPHGEGGSKLDTLQPCQHKEQMPKWERRHILKYYKPFGTSMNVKALWSPIEKVYELHLLEILWFT